ncbi:glycosyltransferase family 1 protein [Prosthecobacter sp. SYSU 5D2]|uniref:glycosyltransferase family 4 protein n=1 Tax=Prosthecobacter sp. SYSU 5D2 TaxID=3134134 RepID=UPI0031FF2657
MTSAPRIHLAPAHPCMGWISMNRYWQALLLESAGDADVRSLFPEVPVESPASPRWVRLWVRRFAYPKLIRSKVKAGVMHLLDHSFADLLKKVPPGVKTVITVHDLIPLTEHSGLTASQQVRFARTVANVALADRVVCVSQHTRSEVRRLLHIPEEKLHVLPNGTSTLPAPEESMRQHLSGLPPFILTVGSSRPRKNLALLPPLARHLAAQGHRATLVRAGDRLDESLASEIRQHADLHELGGVSDAALAAAYATAALTLVPSTHEGFGLPVLEAMHAGCPVVHSLATSLPEVAGEAGLGFDPADAAQAAALCLQILTDPSLRQQKISAGLERAAEFTWKAHWQGLQKIYMELLQS